MKIAVTGIASLEKLMMALPFLKGLKDTHREADLYVVGPEHYKKIKDFCPYISEVIEGLGEHSFDNVINVADLKVPACVGYHYTDQLLDLIPKEVRRRQILLKDTVDGLDELHKMSEDNFDLIVYPFQNSESIFWDEKGFIQFLTYFFQMNPERKICVVGYEHQRAELEKKYMSEAYPRGLLQVEICSLDKMLSLMKRSSHILTGDSATKFLGNNEASIVIEVRSEQSTILSTDCAYKDNNFLVNFKSQLRNKVVYTYDEIVFDNHAHFLSYLVTSILDEDEEKLRWFADTYQNVVDIYKSRIDTELGLLLLPVFWSPTAMLRALVEMSLRLKALQVNKPHYGEEFYFSIHDDSDFSQEKIMYDLGHIQKYLEHLVSFFRGSNDFAKQMKSKNSAPGSLDEAVLSLTQSHEDFVTTLFFIRQVMNVSTQKLLENLPMTASYYS